MELSRKKSEQARLGTNLNLLTEIILFSGLHEFSQYCNFMRASRRTRKAVFECLPHQLKLLQQGRVSEAMNQLIELDKVYEKRFEKKLEVCEEILADIETVGV